MAAPDYAASDPEILLAPWEASTHARGGWRLGAAVPAAPGRETGPSRSRPRSGCCAPTFDSSMKIRRCGSRSGLPLNQALRRASTSGRSCSAAWADFF